MKKPRIFISYSHQPPEHQTNASKWIRTLKSLGSIEISWDQDVQSPQGPPEGWTAWMRQEIQTADWVIIICNQSYLNSWQKLPESGRGVAYEAALLLLELYNSRMINRKLIPVVLQEPDSQYIPSELKDFTYYLIPNEQDLLVTRLLKGTWLGRFVEGLASVSPAPIDTDISPSTILKDAEDLEQEAISNPGLKVLQDALQSECQRLADSLAQANNKIESDKAIIDFAKSFCPRAKELLALHGNLPEVLVPFYDRYC